MGSAPFDLFFDSFAWVAGERKQRRGGGEVCKVCRDDSKGESTVEVVAVCEVRESAPSCSPDLARVRCCLGAPRC